ncbi:MAG: toll/interleukin-1 receptor domain-containing protein [Bryobacteraceae bacterium]
MASDESSGPSSEQLAVLVRQCLTEGASVEIDGLGTFIPDAQDGFRFQPRNRPRVFVAYVKEDADAAERLYENLETCGFDPWLDRRKLLPGQNWPRSIEEAINTSDFFIACFSHRAVKKKGGFQAELRFALECTQRIPLDEIFLIPARLDACCVPMRIQRETQYIDLFPDWDRGFRHMVTAMRRQWHRHAGHLTPSAQQLH